MITPNHVHVPSTTHRFWARLIDGAVISVFLAPALGFKALATAGTGPLELPWALVIYLLAAPIAYETLAVWIFATTAGKWVFDLRVVSARDDRRSPSGWSALLRSVTGKFDMIFGHAVQAMMLFRYDRTHVADWVAGTRVVASRERLLKPRLRYVLGGVLMLLMGTAGWASAGLFMKNLAWDANGLTVGASWSLLVLSRF